MERKKISHMEWKEMGFSSHTLPKDLLSLKQTLPIRERSKIALFPASLGAWLATMCPNRDKPQTCIFSTWELGKVGFSYN